MKQSETTHGSPWRKWLRIHPDAELFPHVEGDDLRALADDIKQHKQHEPCTYIKDAQGYVLLDGRNRLDARELAGLKIDLNDRAVFEQLSSTIDVTAFVISKNIHRRHLAPEKKRDLIGLLLEANPERSDRAIAATTKVDHKTVAAVRREKEATGEIPQLEKTVGADNKTRKRPAKVVADKKPADKPPTKADTSPEVGWCLVQAWDGASQQEREHFVRARLAELRRVAAAVKAGAAS
jgi:hypothetical protein